MTYLLTYIIPILAGSGIYHFNHGLGELTTGLLTILMIAAYAGRNRNRSTHKRNRNF